jgi:hypothetical protein
VGYTSITFAPPPSADVSFTPPAGAQVTRVSPGQPGQGRGPGAGVPSVSVTGSGWLTVVGLPSSALTSATAGTATSGGPVSVNGGSGDSAAVLRALLASATPVHGAWGTGRLLRTSLVSLLMTDSGRTFAGAVQPSVLYAAAARAAAS